MTEAAVCVNQAKTKTRSVHFRDQAEKEKRLLKWHVIKNKNDVNRLERVASDLPAHRTQERLLTGQNDTDLSLSLIHSR